MFRSDRGRQRLMNSLRGIDLDNEVQRLLTRRYQETRDDYSIIDLLFRNGTALDALMYKDLFWPSFVEVREMVFWLELVVNDTASGRISRLIEEFNGDRTAVERFVNQIDVPYMFGNPDRSGEVDMQMYEHLAKALQEMWRARLREQFPGRRFEVQLSGEDLTLVVSQRRDPLDRKNLQ